MPYVKKEKTRKIILVKKFNPILQSVDIITRATIIGHIPHSHFLNVVLNIFVIVLLIP